MTINATRSLATALLAVVLGSGAAIAAISDPWITTKTKIALLTTADLRAADVNVDTIDGRVTLHGKVPSKAERAKAASVAESIDGVRHVRNLLRVVPEARQERVDEADARIEARVGAALDGATGLEGSDIAVVSVNEGVVLLGGRADTMSAHLRAIVVASRVPGVREVRTQVQSPVELRDDEVSHLDEPGERSDQTRRGVAETLAKAGEATGEAARTAAAGVADASRDAWITTATKTALLADADVPGVDVNVDTADGIVTLFGIVPSVDARAEAERVTRSVPGVQRVHNALEVVPEARRDLVERRDGELKADVSRAIEGSELLEDEGIDVEVRNGVARLTGDVSGNTERLAASYVVRGTPGVRAVDNDLRVVRR